MQDPLLSLPLLTSSPPVAAAQPDGQFVGPLEKKTPPLLLQRPPDGHGAMSWEELKVLPRSICYKAALLREKLSLQFALVLATVSFLTVFITSRFEIWQLHQKLRVKEYILAPGVQDFTPVTPQSVPDSHIQNTAMEFLQTFGNLNPVNVDEQFSRLAESMTPELRIQFDVETGPWRDQIKNDGISQMMTIQERQIRSNHEGSYEVTAIVKKDLFANREHIGSSDDVIEMVLKLVPPQAGKRWFLQIQSLETHAANAFRVKSRLAPPPTSAPSPNPGDQE